MNLYEVLGLVWLHYLADFPSQNDKMALRKSTSNRWLGLHVLVYMSCFIPFGFFIGFWHSVWFYLINYALHFSTDYVTSRITSRLWREEKRHMFFVVIGLDQALHMTALFVTYSWLHR